MNPLQPLYEKKPLVIIADGSQAQQVFYLQQLQSIATVAGATTLEFASRVIGRDFREGTILVLNDTFTTPMDGRVLLDVALRVSVQHKFSPFIIANASTPEDNKNLVLRGCTLNAETKNGVVHLVEKIIQERPRHPLVTDVFYK